MSYRTANPAWQPPQKSERRLVLSASFGPDPCNRLTEPFRIEYARRVGATCVTLRDYRGIGDAPHWEKLRIRDFLLMGYRVLWVDSDVLIQPGAPDLFAHVWPNRLAAVDELQTGQWQNYYAGNSAAVEALARTLGRPRPFTRSYWNTGVILACPNHADVFALGSDVARSDCVFEQTWLNVRFREALIPAGVWPLPLWANNMTRWDVPCEHGQFLHAAGMPAAEKVSSFLSL